jgi:hypothetical protein
MEYFPQFCRRDVSLAKGSQKLGITNFPGWIAHRTPEGTFVKFSARIRAPFSPEHGLPRELYTCDLMTEMESLGPARSAGTVRGDEHVEYWGLIPDLPKPDSEAVFTEKFRPVIENWLSSTRA